MTPVTAEYNSRVLSPRTEEEALAIQEVLRSRVVSAHGPASPGTVAGLDVAYDGDRVGAAVVVLDAGDLSVRDTAVATGRPAFPYVPGLFAFREVPALMAALECRRPPGRRTAPAAISSG